MFARVFMATLAMLIVNLGPPSGSNQGAGRIFERLAVSETEAKVPQNPKRCIERKLKVRKKNVDQGQDR